jgi:hypothetical protein
MSSRVGFILILGVVGIVASLLTLFSTPSDAIAGQSFKVIASGLDNPRHLTFGPEGALYIAEAGRGATRSEGGCVGSIEFGGEGCVGFTGAVTRLWEGKQERIVTDLHSIANPDTGGFAAGPQAVAFQDRKAYVAVGGCFGVGVQKLGACGELIRLRPNGTWKPIANLLAYEVLNNPDQGKLSTGEDDLSVNPYAVLALPHKRIVVDAGGNDLLSVAPDGKISTLAVFPPRFVQDPFSSGMLPMQSVPTSVALGPDGALYVGEFTGYPFPVGGARIYRVVPGEKHEEPEIYAEGFTSVVDLVFEGDGSLLVLELRKNGLLSGDPTGALIRLKPDGSQETLVSEGLVSPTGVAIGYDGLYISNCGVCGAPPGQPDQAGLGQVIRIVLGEDD